MLSVQFVICQFLRDTRHRVKLKELVFYLLCVSLLFCFVFSISIRRDWSLIVGKKTDKNSTQMKRATVEVASMSSVRVSGQLCIMNVMLPFLRVYFALLFRFDLDVFVCRCHAIKSLFLPCDLNSSAAYIVLVVHSV